MQTTIITILGILMFIGSFLVLDYGYLKWFVFIEPQKEDARRKVFLNTRSYNEGMTQNLIKYLHEYNMSKSPQEREVIASTIRHIYAEYDESKLPVKLRLSLEQIKYGGSK